MLLDTYATVAKQKELGGIIAFCSLTRGASQDEMLASVFNNCVLVNGADISLQNGIAALTPYMIVVHRSTSHISA